MADCGRIDRLGDAILSVAAENSQISDAPGLDGVVNLFLNLVEIVEIGCLYFLYSGHALTFKLDHSMGAD